MNNEQTIEIKQHQRDLRILLSDAKQARHRVTKDVLYEAALCLIKKIF